ncbi:putative E3 ubiquitin-protein ligase [Trypanosoma conorhini]|uniref:RING-type E3 ubiquitin transferase n=1 Tax=Trypanosoma conorhini TaxID=83891 RepID=A0A3R7K494_9TRYP|nr:putative E3 ubiquitin-protein ligase [Trypanosoma conorhini]RNF01428.1 putative E3 ubiquitin-protein ligase [Trypanosoma conorhini]
MPRQAPLRNREVFAKPLEHGARDDEVVALAKTGHASEKSVFPRRGRKKELVVDGASAAHEFTEGSCTDGLSQLVKPLQTQLSALGVVERSTSPVLADKGTPNLLDTKPASPAEGGDSIGSGQCSYSTRNGSVASFGNVCKEKELVAAAEDSEEEELCCICLEGYTEENPVMYGECRHHFHVPCLMNWKQRSNVCPMCASETLKGLADDDDAPATVRAADEEIFAMLLQHQLGRYTFPGRRHRQRGCVRPCGHELAPQDAERHAARRTNAPQRQQDRAAALEERQRPARDRRENGTRANAAARKGTRGEAATRVRDMHESGLAAFFNRVFCCFKR